MNKFPDYVGYLVRWLKAMCPAMGKKRIAQVLARAGLHLGSTTVGRMLKQQPDLNEPADEALTIEESPPVSRAIKAKDWLPESYGNDNWLSVVIAVSTGVRSGRDKSTLCSQSRTARGPVGT